MLDGRDGPCSCGVPATRSLVHVNKVAVFMAVCWVHSLRAEMVDSLRSFREAAPGFLCWTVGAEMGGNRAV